MRDAVMLVKYVTKSMTNFGADLTLGGHYVVFGVAMDIEPNGGTVGPCFLLREDHEGPGVLYFDASLFEVVDHKIPPDFIVNLKPVNGQKYMLEVAHCQFAGNSDLYDRINDRDEEAIAELLSIERTIISQMNYETFFPSFNVAR